MHVVLQDLPDRVVGQSADFERPQAGSLESVAPMGPGDPDDAEAGTEAQFGTRLRSQHQIHQGRGVGADPRGLSADLAGRHAGVSALAGAHLVHHGGVFAVARGAHVGVNALTAVEDLDGPRRNPDAEDLLQDLLRHRVVVPLNLNMVFLPCDRSVRRPLGPSCELTPISNGQSGMNIEA